jgi:hypothetical protein
MTVMGHASGQFYRSLNTNLTQNVKNYSGGADSPDKVYRRVFDYFRPSPVLDTEAGELKACVRVNYLALGEQKGKVAVFRKQSFSLPVCWTSPTGKCV